MLSISPRRLPSSGRAGRKRNFLSTFSSAYTLNRISGSSKVRIPVNCGTLKRSMNSMHLHIKM